MEIVQSVIFSMTRVKLSLYESRIMTKIVEYAQLSIKGERARMVGTKLRHKDPNCRIVLPARYILDEGNDHYNYVYAAISALMARTFEYYDPSKKIWHSSPIIYNATVRAHSGEVVFYVSSTLLDVLLDFTQGYKAYELQTALSLQNAAAVRLYIIMSKQCTPLTYSIDNLKKMFGVADKYKQTADFIKKVIEPARKCLDEAKADGFTYVRIKNGTKVVGLTFFPKKNTKENISAILSSHEEKEIYTNVKMWLRNFAGFTSQEVAANSKIIMRFSKLPQCLDLLDNIERKSRRAKNPKGYIIASVKTEIAAATNK